MDKNSTTRLTGSPPVISSKTIVHESKTRFISVKDAAKKQYRDLQNAASNASNQTVDTVRQSKTEKWDSKTGFEKVKNGPGDSQIIQCLDSNF